MPTPETTITVSSFTRRQEEREQAKATKIAPIATSEFISWLERNDHARGVAIHCINDESRTDEQKSAHLKSIMGHGYQGRYIQWYAVTAWLKERAEQDAQADYEENESLRQAERGGYRYDGYDLTDEERVGQMMAAAAEITPKFEKGDHVIDDTGFSGKVTLVDRVDPSRVKIEYLVRSEQWASADDLTKTDAPPAPISVLKLLQAYQSCTPEQLRDVVGQPA